MYRWLALMVLPLLLAGCMARAPAFPAYPTQAEALTRVLDQNAQIVYSEPFGQDRTLVLFRTDRHPAITATLLEKTALGKWHMTDGVGQSQSLPSLGSLTYDRANLGFYEEQVGRVTHVKAEDHVVFGEVRDPAITWVELTLYEEGAEPLRAKVQNGIWLVHLKPDQQNTWFSLRAGHADETRFMAHVGHPSGLPGELLDYVDAKSGIRLKYPASLGLRVDATGQVIVSDGAKQLTVLRTPAAGGARLEDLMARLLKESGESTTERITTEEQSIRRLGPHEAAYVRETAESKEGKRYTYTYYVLTGEAAYRVTCGTPTVPNPLPWEYLQPDCDSLLQGIVRLGS